MKKLIILAFAAVIMAGCNQNPTYEIDTKKKGLTVRVINYINVK